MVLLPWCVKRIGGRRNITAYTELHEHRRFFLCRRQCSSPLGSLCAELILTAVCMFVYLGTQPVNRCKP